VIEAYELPGIAQPHRLQGLAVCKLLDANDDVRDVVAKLLRQLPGCLLRQLFDGSLMGLMRDNVGNHSDMGTTMRHFHPL
jgi:hypothetical protein